MGDPNICINCGVDTHRDGDPASVWGSSASVRVSCADCFLLVTLAFPQDAADLPDRMKPRIGENQVKRVDTLVSSWTSLCLSMVRQ